MSPATPFPPQVMRPCTIAEMAACFTKHMNEAGLRLSNLNMDETMSRACTRC